MNLVSYSFTPDWGNYLRIAEPALTEQIARFSGWTVNISRRQLIAHNGVRVRLSPVEFALLLAFLEAPHRIVGRDRLLHKLNPREDVSLRAIDCYISRLRRRLAVTAGTRSPIETIRGRGYLFDADVAFEQVVHAPVPARQP